jgi:hypothetical protein
MNRMEINKVIIYLQVNIYIPYTTEKKLPSLYSNSKQIPNRTNMLILLTILTCIMNDIVKINYSF